MRNGQGNLPYLVVVLPIRPRYSTPMGYGVGGEGVVCIAMVGWMYTGRYPAVSGVSTVHTS